MESNAIIVAIISSGLLTTLINRLFSRIDKKREAKNGTNEALRLILKDRLRFLSLKYIDQGWIYSDELEDLLAGHVIYHNKLGGNGYLDILISKVKALPIRGADHH